MAGLSGIPGLSEALAKYPALAAIPVNTRQPDQAPPPAATGGATSWLAKRKPNTTPKPTQTIAGTPSSWMRGNGAGG